MLPSRRVVTRPAARSTARCWLMFGTWQATRPASSLTDSSPTDEQFEHAQPLRIGERTAHDRGPFVLRLAVVPARRTGCELDCHARTIAPFAQSRKSAEPSEATCMLPPDARDRGSAAPAGATAAGAAPAGAGRAQPDRSRLPALRRVCPAKHPRGLAACLDADLRAALCATGRQRRPAPRPGIQPRDPARLGVHRPARARRVRAGRDPRAGWRRAAAERSGDGGRR